MGRRIVQQNRGRERTGDGTRGYRKKRESAFVNAMVLL